MTRAIWKTLKIQVKLILNCPRALAITCLSHKGKNLLQRRGEEQNREEGEMAQTKLGGRRKRKVGSREN